MPKMVIFMIFFGCKKLQSPYTDPPISCPTHLDCFRGKIGRKNDGESQNFKKNPKNRVFGLKMA